MKVVRSPKEMHQTMWGLKSKRKQIGLVPTMGALHEGHLNLIRKARKENDVVVVSLFVNPIQFGPGEDYKTYPRNFQADVKKCRESRVDYIFYPRAKDMFAQDYVTYVEVSRLSDLLCGSQRPGHFKGVATVVLKLFHIIMPDNAYFGLKDFQQYVIIKKMVKDLDLGVRVVGLPIVREKIGIAMSSRNAYLSPMEKDEVTLLSMALFYAKGLVQTGETSCDRIKKSVYRILLSGRIIKPRNIDYICIVDPETLEEQKSVKKPCVLLLAVRIGKARLIDNIIM